MNCQRTSFTVSAVLMLLLLMAFPAWASTPLTPGGTNVIKTAVEAAQPGTTFTLSAGVYTEDPFFIPSGVNIYGVDRRTVTIQESASTVYQGGTAFIWVKGSNVNLAGFTAQGRGVKGMKLPDNTVLPNDNSAKYGINMAGSLNTPVVNNTNVTLTNITSRYFNGTGVNINGANGMTLNKVESVYNNGAGVYLSDAHNIAINNVTTNGNAWGGVCVNVYGATFAAGTSGIVFSGANSFGESGSGGYGLWLESDAYPNHHQNGELITYSDNPAAGAQVTIQASDFAYASDAIYYDFTGDNLTRRLFFASAADASAYLTPLNAALAALGRSYGMVALSAGSTFAKSIFSSLPAATLETLTGPAGPAGAPGPQGPAGLNGSAGAIGPQGVAGAAAAVLSTSNLAAVQKGGAQLAASQNSDGGWAWPLTGPSAQNTIGPIGMGLGEAYLQTGDASMLSALQKSGTFLLAKTNNFSPSDGYLAAKLDRILGGNTYRSHVTANYYAPLAAGTYNRNGAGTLLTTAAYLQAIHDSRGGSQAEMAAWDLGMALAGAAAAGADTAPFVDAVKSKLNEMNSSGAYAIIGLAGAVYGLSAVHADFDPTAGSYAAASSVADLAAILAGYQDPDGGFTWQKDVQESWEQGTAYVMLALNAANRTLYLAKIQAAADYLTSVQEATGDVGGNHEVTGEALWAYGITAPAGPIGPKGLVGEKGEKGETGEKGIKGDTGNAGYTPVKGIDYFDGAKGEQGLPGRDGSPDTQEQILNKIGTSTNGAVLAMQQGENEGTNAAKMVVKDKNGNTNFTVQANGSVAIGTPSSTSTMTLDSSAATGVPQGVGMLLLTGTNNKERIELRSFGPGQNPAPVIQGKGAQWINSAPTSTIDGTTLIVLGGSGYDDQGNNIIGLKGLISTKAEGNWSTISQGAQLRFETTPSGSTVRTEKMRITGAGNIGVGATAPTQKMEVNGGIRLNTTTGKPACDPASRGTFWVTQGSPNDLVEVCAMVNGSLTWKALW